MKASHAKYGKFSYSSAFAYSVPSGGFTLEQFALDSTLGLSDDGEETWKTRRLCTSAGITNEGEEKEAVLKSEWAPYSDVSIKSWIVPSKEETPNWHIRAHRIESRRDLVLAEGSFAMANVRQDNARALDVLSEGSQEGTFPRIRGNYDLTSSGTRSGRGEGTYALCLGRGAVGVVDLLEIDREGETEAMEKGDFAMIVNADPNTNLMESKTVIPTLMGKMGKGETKWFVSGIFGRPHGEHVLPGSYLDGWGQKPKVPGWLKELIKAG